MARVALPNRLRKPLTLFLLLAATLLTGCEQETFKPTQEFFGTWGMPVYAKSQGRKLCTPGSGLMMVGTDSFILDFGKNRPVRLDKVKFYRSERRFSVEHSIDDSHTIDTRYVFKIDGERLSLRRIGGYLARRYLGMKQYLFFKKYLRGMVRCS